MVFGSVSIPSKVVLASAFPAVVAGVGFSKESASDFNCPKYGDITKDIHFWRTTDIHPTTGKGVWYGWSVGGDNTAADTTDTSTQTAQLRGAICVSQIQFGQGNDVSLAYRTSTSEPVTGSSLCKEGEYEVEAIVTQTAGRSVPANKTQNNSCASLNWNIQQGRSIPYQCRIGDPYVISNQVCPVVYDMMFYFQDKDNKYYSLTPSVGNKFTPKQVAVNADEFKTYFIKALPSTSAEIIQMFMPHSVYPLGNVKPQSFANQKDYILVQKSGCQAMRAVQRQADSSKLLKTLTAPDGLQKCTCITFPPDNTVVPAHGPPAGLNNENCKQFFDKKTGQGLNLGTYFTHHLLQNPGENAYIIAL